MWLWLATILAFVAAVGPIWALQVYELRRWRRETGRKGWFRAMRYDSEYVRAARRSGRALLGVLAGLWFIFGFVVFSFLLDAVLDAL